MKLFYLFLLFQVSFSVDFNYLKFFEEKSFTKEFYFLIKKLLADDFRESEGNLQDLVKFKYELPSFDDSSYRWGYRWGGLKENSYIFNFKVKNKKILLDSILFTENCLEINYFDNETNNLIQEKNFIVDKQFDKFLFLKNNLKNLFKIVKPYLLNENSTFLKIFLPSLKVVERSISSCRRCGKKSYCNCINGETGGDFKEYKSNCLLESQFLDNDSDMKSLKEIEEEFKKEFNINIKFFFK